MADDFGPVTIITADGSTTGYLTSDDRLVPDPHDLEPLRVAAQGTSFQRLRAGLAQGGFGDPTVDPDGVSRADSWQTLNLLDIIRTVYGTDLSATWDELEARAERDAFIAAHQPTEAGR